MSDLTDTLAPARRVRDAAGSARVSARSARLRWGGLPVLGALLFVAIVVATARGAVDISPLHTLAILLNHTGVFHLPQSWAATDEVIILQIRLPRVVGAALVGAALATSGALFQALLRNPLADPLLLGTSAGAAFGATLAFMFPALIWFGFGLVPLLAFGGALLAVTVVYWLATRGGHTPVVTLLLAGVAVNALLTAAQTLFITLDPTLAQHIFSLYLWLAGGVQVEGWSQLGIIGALIVAGAVVAFYLAPALDGFALGEEMAGHLGIQVERRKRLIVGAAALLVAAAVSISGLVGFVGLVAPHACRLVFGPRHRQLIPATALTGALFVVIADVLARTLAAPAELPLGVLTALVGGPFFLALLRQAGQAYRW